MKVPIALTIAGSSSAGGTGIQADLKTFSALGVYGASAITCVNAQNPDGVQEIYPLPADIVTKQIHAVCTTFPVKVAKTGMLYSSEIIRAVVAEDLSEGIAVLVVDPVMVNNSGDRLLQADAVETLCKELMPVARIVTPNLHEAEILCGSSISSVEELRTAAREIGQRYDVACVAKGGHLTSDEVVDVLYDEGEEQVFSSPRVHAVSTHGAGSAFSAALTAYLGQGELLCDAVAAAKAYVAHALRSANDVGNHRSLNFFWREDEAGS